MNWTEGTVLQAGKYKVIRQIGGGGFGLTYLAEDNLERQVVIKAPNQVFQRDQDYEKFLRRFKREGQVLARIKHPNIVQVIEFFQERGMPCLAMEYIKGPTLSEYVRQHNYLPQDKAVEYFRALAQALHLVHQADLIHCDVHPGNVILQNEQKPVLIDFGSAKSLRPSTYTVTTTINDSYSAYEQRKGEPRPTLDVYGLAATLYFATTGQKPPSAMDRKLYGDQLQPPQKHRPDLKIWINQAILRGMELEAEDRAPSMQAWLGLLYPPQLKTAKPKQSAPTTSTKTRSSQQYKPSLPWSSLGWLTGSYLPIGLIIGVFSPSPLYVAGAGAGAVAVAGVGAVASDLAGAEAGAGAGALALALAGALALGLALGLAGALALALAMAVALAVAMAGALTGDGAMAVAMAVAVAGVGAGIVAGAGAGTWTIAGALAGAGAGAAIRISYTDLQKYFREFSIFCIWVAASTIGLILGLGLGWGMKLAGISLPT